MPDRLHHLRETLRHRPLRQQGLACAPESTRTSMEHSTGYSNCSAEPFERPLNGSTEQLFLAFAHFMSVVAMKALKSSLAEATLVNCCCQETLLLLPLCLALWEALLPSLQFLLSPSSLLACHHGMHELFTSAADRMFEGQQSLWSTWESYYLPHSSHPLRMLLTSSWASLKLSPNALLS